MERRRYTSQPQPLRVVYDTRRRTTFPTSCVDGPRPARDYVARGAVVACSHVSGLLVQSGWTAGPDGFREPRPHHLNGPDVLLKREVSLDCSGSTERATTLQVSRKPVRDARKPMP